MKNIALTQRHAVFDQGNAAGCDASGMQRHRSAAHNVRRRSDVQVGPPLRRTCSARESIEPLMMTSSSGLRRGLGHRVSARLAPSVPHGAFLP